jgi:hypothetical protein
MKKERKHKSARPAPKRERPAPRSLSTDELRRVQGGCGGGTVSFTNDFGERNYCA